jgi:preprotein translocase subunit SecE
MLKGYHGTTKENIMARTSPIEFLKQVRSEAKKITWPTRQETTQGTIAVFIMVAIAALFLFIADQVIAVIIRFILGLG